MFYLIKNEIKLVDFKAFAEKQTEILCDHIENYIKGNGITLQYLPSGKLDKRELALQEMKGDATKTGLIALSIIKINTSKRNKNSQIK